MGLVLAFQTAPRSATRTPPRRTDAPQSADILFFTGVRYERPERETLPQKDRQPEAPASVHPAS